MGAETLEAHMSSNRLVSKIDLSLDIKEARKLSAFKARFLMLMHNPKIYAPFQRLFDTLGSIEAEKFPISYCCHFLRFGNEGTSKLDYVFFLSSELANSQENWGNNLENTPNKSDLDRVFMETFKKIDTMMASKDKLLVLLRFFSPYTQDAPDSNGRLNAAHITFFTPFTSATSEKNIYTTSFLLSYNTALKLRSQSIPQEKIFTLLQNTRLNQLLEHPYAYISKKGEIREGFFIVDAPAIIPIENAECSLKLPLPDEKISDIFFALDEIYQVTQPRIGSVIPSPQDEREIQACLTPESSSSPVRKRVASFNDNLERGKESCAPDDLPFDTPDTPEIFFPEIKDHYTISINPESKKIYAGTRPQQNRPPGKLGKIILNLEKYSKTIKMEALSSLLVPSKPEMLTPPKHFRKRASSFNVTLSTKKIEALEETQESKIENETEPEKTTFEDTHDLQQEKQKSWTPTKSKPTETGVIIGKKKEMEIQILMPSHWPISIKSTKPCKQHFLPETPAPLLSQTMQYTKLFTDPLIVMSAAKQSKAPKIESFVLMWTPVFDPFSLELEIHKEKPFSSLLHQRLQESSSSKKAGDPQAEPKDTLDSIRAFFLRFKNFLKQISTLWYHDDM